MRIAHVMHNYYPVIGGIERVVQKIAEEQARQGHEVHVVTGFEGARNGLAEEELNSVYIHRVRSWRLHYPDLTVPRGSYKGFLRDVDVVHVHSQNSLFSMMVAEGAKSLGVKVAVHFMAVNAFRDHPSTLIRVFGSVYGMRMVMKALNLADIKMVRSLRDEEILRNEFCVKDIHFVPDGTDEKFFTTPSLEEEFRKKYNLYDDIVLFLGRLHPLKGVEVLLRAVPHVVKENSRVKFVFVGPGISECYMEIASDLKIDDNVLFLGFVDERTKIGVIDSSRCLVLPSTCDYVEVYPMVISEAWSRGKPCVASNVGGIPYRVKDMANGILVPPKNPEALAEAILKLLRDKTVAMRLGLEGRKGLENWNNIASTLINLYEESLTQ